MYKPVVCWCATNHRIQSYMKVKKSLTSALFVEIHHYSDVISVPGSGLWLLIYMSRNSSQLTLCCTHWSASKSSWSWSISLWMLVWQNVPLTLALVFWSSSANRHFMNNLRQRMLPANFRCLCLLSDHIFFISGNSLSTKAMWRWRWLCVLQDQQPYHYDGHTKFTETNCTFGDYINE